MGHLLSVGGAGRAGQGVTRGGEAVCAEGPCRVCLARVGLRCAECSPFPSVTCSSRGSRPHAGGRCRREARAAPPLTVNRPLLLLRLPMKKRAPRTDRAAGKGTSAALEKAEEGFGAEGGQWPPICADRGGRNEGPRGWAVRAAGIQPLVVLPKLLGGLPAPSNAGGSWHMTKWLCSLATLSHGSSRILFS